MSVCPVCHGLVIQPKRGRRKIYDKDRCKWTAQRRREGRVPKEDYVRKGMKAQPSCKMEWGRDNRLRFTDKLLRCGWTHYRDCKRFESEIYQKNHSRIEVDSGGCWLWAFAGPGAFAEGFWWRCAGLCDMDIDQAKGDVLLFRGGTRGKRFDLASGNWV